MIFDNIPCISLPIFKQNSFSFLPPVFFLFSVTTSPPHCIPGPSHHRHLLVLIPPRVRWHWRTAPHQRGLCRLADRAGGALDSIGAAPREPSIRASEQPPCLAPAGVAAAEASSGEEKAASAASSGEETAAAAVCFGEERAASAVSSGEEPAAAAACFGEETAASAASCACGRTSVKDDLNTKKGKNKSSQPPFQRRTTKSIRCNY